MAEGSDNQKDLAAGVGGSAPKPMMVLAMALGAVVVFGAGGYLAGTMLMAPQQTQAQAADPQSQENADPPPNASMDFHYYELEPITVNLDEPRMARYVRVVVMLAIEPQNQKAAVAALDAAKPEVRSFLNSYMSSRTLDDVRGGASHERIRREILDSLNKQLWPNAKPLIHHVLTPELVIQ